MKNKTHVNCKKCNNPLIIYWCADCGNSYDGKNTCTHCGKTGKLDKNYHKNCN